MAQISRSGHGFLIFSCLLSFASASFAAASTPMINPDGIVMDSAGHSIKMSQSEASKLCFDRNMHLPTIREWMKVCGTEGSSKGVATAVRALNESGAKDEFEAVCAYKKLAGALGKDWFWSSSATTDGKNEFYVFNGNTFYVGTGPANYVDEHGSRGAVRCLPGRVLKQKSPAQKN